MRWELCAVRHAAAGAEDAAAEDAAEGDEEDADGLAETAPGPSRRKWPAPRPETPR